MATQALTLPETAIGNTITYVSAGVAGTYRAFLAANFTEDNVVRFESTVAGARIEILDNVGRRIASVAPKTSKSLSLREPPAAGVPDSWAVYEGVSDPATFLAAAPAGGTGATAGAYDTAGNRDLLIALVNAMRLQLVSHGWMKAE